MKYKPASVRYKKRACFFWVMINALVKSYLFMGCTFREGKKHLFILILPVTFVSSLLTHHAVIL